MPLQIKYQHGQGGLNQANKGSFTFISYYIALLILPRIFCILITLLFALQVKLYEDFAKSQARKSIDSDVERESGMEKQPERKEMAGHIFQVSDSARFS